MNPPIVTVPIVPTLTLGNTPGHYSIPTHRYNNTCTTAHTDPLENGIDTQKSSHPDGHKSNTCLLSICYIPGTILVLGIRYKNPCPSGAYILVSRVGEHHNQMTQTIVTHSDTDRCQTPTCTGSHINPQLPTISLTHTHSHTDIHTQIEAHRSTNT